jgi:hypothetical protein
MYTIGTHIQREAIELQLQRTEFVAILSRVLKQSLYRLLFSRFGLVLCIE